MTQNHHDNTFGYQSDLEENRQQQQQQQRQHDENTGPQRYVRWINRQNLTASHPRQEDGHVHTKKYDEHDWNDGDEWECIPDMNTVELCTSPVSSSSSSTLSLLSLQRENTNRNSTQLQEIS